MNKDDIKYTSISRLNPDKQGWKNLRRVMLFTCVTGALLGGTAVKAKVITYPNPEVELSMDPFDNAVSLFIEDSLSDNVVVIEVGGTISGNAYGGVTAGADRVTNNQITNSGTLGGNIYGGRSDDGDVENNSLTMDSGSANLAVGGYTENGNSLGNIVKINGDAEGKNVYGGRSGSGNAEYNTVTIDNATVIRSAAGGYAKKGDVSNNVITLNGGTVGGYFEKERTYYGISGGSTNSGDAVNNRVNMNGGSAGFLTGGYSSEGTARGNVVRMTDGLAMDSSMAGFSVDGDVVGNTFILDGGTLEEYLYGGRTFYGNAVENTVDISGGSVKESVSGGWSNFKSATGNTVNISGGVISGDIYGGSADSMSKGPNIQIASGNTVNISGGTISGDVYGGYAYDEATDNVVNLSGTPDLKDTTIYGGFFRDDAGVVRDNTLNVTDFEGTLVNVKNFANYNFSLTSMSSSGPVLTLTDKSGTDISGSTIRFTGEKVEGGGALLEVGDSFDLIYNANGLNTSDTVIEMPATGGIQKGIALMYDFSLTSDENRIATKLTSIKVNPDAGTLPKGRIAELALLNQGRNAMSRVKVNGLSVPSGKYDPFATINIAYDRYGVKPYMGLTGFNGIAGVNISALNGAMYISPFVEGGYGKYSAEDKTYSGYVKYYGLGLNLQYVFKNDIYAEGSLRVGRTGDGFENIQLMDVHGRSAIYDVNSSYIGANVGTGWTYRISDKIAADISGKYSYTHISGASTKVVDDPLEFQAINSHILRIGGRVNMNVTSLINAYCGLAWEHEFGSDVSAKVYGYDLDTSSLKGNAISAEVGANIGIKESPASLKLSLEGSLGQRKGVQANVMFDYQF